MSKTTRSDRGSILMIVLILMITIIGMAGALLSASSMHKKSTVTGQRLDHAMAVAEAGIDDTVNKLNTWTSGTISSNSGSISTGTFSVTVTPAFSGNAALYYSIQSTGTVSTSRKTITVVVASVSSGLFQYGLFGDKGVTMSGGSTTDGYSSAKGSYASQAVNYDATHKHYYADQTGNTGSNASIVTSGGGTGIYGSATPGVGYTWSGSGGSYVTGSTAPATQPVVLRPVAYSPTVPSSGAYKQTGGSNTFSAGAYHYSSFNMSGGSAVTFSGSVTLYVDGDFVTSGSSTLTVAAGASLVIYQATGAFNVSGGGLVNASGTPANLQIYSATDTSLNASNKVDISGGSTFYGTLYAPKALFKPSGGTTFVGSFIAGQVDDSGGSSFHYDEDLSKLGGAPKYKTKSWYEKPSDN